MFALKSKIEITIRLFLIAVIAGNACAPTTALRAPGQRPGAAPGNESAQERPATTPEQKSVFYDPPAIDSPQQISPEPGKTEPRVPSKEAVEFTLTAEPAVVPANGLVTFRVHIRNHSAQELTSVMFRDALETGLTYHPDGKSPVTLDPQKQEVTLALERLDVGQEYDFSYSVMVTAAMGNALKGKVWLHNVELTSSQSSLHLKTGAAITAGLANASATSALALLKPQGGWNSLGPVAIHMDQDAVGENALVMLSLANVSDQGPALQFNLDVYETGSMAVDAQSQLDEQTISLKQQHEEPFNTPAFLEIDLDGYVDLKNIPAGQEPYVATYDEEHKVWVKVPILTTDPIDNSVTVEAAHFSTWGAGLGSSLPQNGANVLLFDQPYTSLFTGSARYSLPLWTPPGRAGMQPNISLSYSSATVDGVLGDVQAPWVGVGWNIDDVEIVRKIMSDENGYGYRNEFALTLNGTLYQLVRDEFHQDRFFTHQAAFLYIERHNALSGSPSPENTTGEWWEVVTTDGTRYRLGWNEDSEQLALMYGYACTVNGSSCNTPNGAYASLGYAGNAKDLVAMRWRVDKVSDTHGNYMEYNYSETQPDLSTTLALFDRESYLKSIQFTGFDDPEEKDGREDHIDPAYQIAFSYGDRFSIGDVPTEFNIWDNIDSQFLEKIEVICLLCTTEPAKAPIRTYKFGYSLANVPNANGTLTLTSVEVTGGGYTENGQLVPATRAPTIRFTYQNKDNRAGGNGDVFAYPRLAAIDNGTGGLLTFTYEHDGRANNSWYNYRVQNVLVDSGMGAARKQSYTYATPVYSGQGGNSALGSLTGYTTVTESLLDFLNNDAAILKTKHTFGTTGLDIGYEMQTEWLDNNGTALRKTANIYVTDNSGAPKDNNGNPFPGWNYRYLGETSNYERSGNGLALITRNTYYRDPFTGNLLLQSTYLGNSLYRKTYYEYLTNPAAKYHILNTASRVLVVDAGNQIYGDVRYQYDNKVNEAPIYGDVTLVQRLTGNGDQTVDTVTEYDPYGNVTSASVRQEGTYGTVNVYPMGPLWTSYTSYDPELQTYPIRTKNVLGQESSANYFHTLGLVYQSADLNQWTTSTMYDGLGRPVSITPPGLEQPGTRYLYPPLDQNGKISAPHAVEMQILDTIAEPDVYRSVWGIYDGAGRMLQTQVKAGDKLLVNTTQFNAQGLAVQQSLPYQVTEEGGDYVSNPGNQFTATAYDALGRVRSVTAPGDITTQTSYDGLTTTTLDPNRNKVDRTTDGLGRLISVVEFSNASTVYGTTRYFYDAADRLLQVKDAKSNSTVLTYDWLGRKVSMVDPDMGTWTYAYDALGNMTSQMDNRQCQLSFEYDALNRLKRKSSSGATCGQAAEAEYFYDDDDPATTDYDPVTGNAYGFYGVRTAMMDASGSTVWRYPLLDLGKTVEEVRTINGEKEHTVTTRADWLGRVLTTRYDDGEVISYTYDELGRPDSLNSSQSTVPLVDLVYNVLGQIKTQALGNGTTIENSYADDTARLTNRTATAGDNTPLLNLSYKYDHNGNITRLEDSVLGETQFFAYDFLNRLTRAVGANGAPDAAPATPELYGQQFEYDQIGNIERIDNWGTVPAQTQGKAPSDPFKFASALDPRLQSGNKALFAPAPANQLEETPPPTETPTPPDVTSTPLSTPTPRLDDTYTVSLLHMNETGTFTDESDKTWTAAGNAQIDVAQSQFGGASGSFDGNGDYLYTADHADFNFGGGDFTIDTWVRFNALPAASNYVLLYNDTNVSGTYNQWYLANASGNLSMRWASYNAGTAVIDTGAVPWTPSVGTWYHLAAVRNGNRFNLYVNGASIKALSGISGAIGNPAANISIGAQINTPGNTTLNGWLDEFRVSKGIARWTKNFIPPVSEYVYTDPTPTPAVTSMPIVVPDTDDSYTVSLLPMEGVDGSTSFLDGSGKIWTANGHALIDTTQSKFGGASAFFDGTGDYISTSDHADFDVAAGNFTIDFWVRRNTNGYQRITGRINATNAATISWFMQFDSANHLQAGIYTNPAFTASTGTITADGMWHHVALVRNGNTIQLYIDGTADGSVSAAGVTANRSASKVAIGDLGEIGGPYFNGWIDEFRFSKGIARWTSDFTPPTTEYVPGTMSESLAAHWNFEGVTSTTVPDVAGGQPYVNNATLQNGATIIPDGANGSAVSFDGADDSAVVADQMEIKKSGSFTVSAWVNPASLVTSRTQYILNKGVSATDFDYGLITTSTTGTPTPTPPANVDPNGKLVFRVGDLTPNKVVGPVLPINTWTLVTGVYDCPRGELRLYLNGTLVAVEKVTGTVSMGTGALSFSPAGNLFHGKLDDVRFYNRALTDEEVDALFGEFTAPTPVPSETVTPETPTETPTPLPVSAQQWGTGADGNITINAGEAYNINASPSKITGRTCPDGVAYAVSGLNNTTAYLSPALAEGCLKAGDEVLLINLLGTPSSANYNAGSYEFLRVASVGADYVRFATMKLHWYGDGWRSDSNIGTGAGQQRVMLMRVPNYGDVTVNGQLTASAFDGYKGGVVAFRVANNFTGTTATASVSANTLGFTGGYEGDFSSTPAVGYGAGYNGINDDSTHTSSGGGGGSYGTAGGSGAATYGNPQLNQLFFGSGGGGSGGHYYYGYLCGPDNSVKCWQWDPGPWGSTGGGIVFIAGKTINFLGSIQANGGNSAAGVGGVGSGGGAGGSIRIEGDTIALNGMTAAGGAASYASTQGGNGRIAVYYQSSNSVAASNPASYTGRIEQSGPQTPVPTPINLNPDVYGTGADGDLIVDSRFTNSTFNVSTNVSGTRVCADGISYSVTELLITSAKLSVSPPAKCLVAGDEVLLIHLAGSGPNIGNFEYLRVGAVVGDTVYFKSAKRNFYGANAGDDSNVGVSAGQQRVMLMRVPNYNNVTLNGSITTNAFNGYTGGVVAFRVANNFTGTTATASISADSLGFNGGTVARLSITLPSGYAAGPNGVANDSTHTGSGGAGGGYGTAGGGGAATYGNPQLNQLFFGSGGGGSGGTYRHGYFCGKDNSRRCWQWDQGPSGGAGGGIIFIAGKTINFPGNLLARGVNSSPGAGGVPSGGGAGGSIRIEGDTIALSGVLANGGAPSYANTQGGNGRIAIYYSGSLANAQTVCAAASTYCQNTSLVTPTTVPTEPTPSATPSPTPAPQGWTASDYTYSTDIPHAVTSVDKGQSSVNSYEYDENGNMTCRTEDGVTYEQLYNAENRISAIHKREGDCQTGTIVESWSYVYDGDGVRMHTSHDTGSANIITTRYYFGGAYEVNDSGTEAREDDLVRKYYSFGGQIVAMRDALGLNYFITDHLGSVAVVMKANGGVEQQRYLPFGQPRELSNYSTIQLTDFTYSGQRDLPGTGLMDYKARFYSPTLGRFIQPDTIVPGAGNPQNWNRFSYVMNNPLQYNDPTGNKPCRSNYLCKRRAEKLKAKEAANTPLPINTPEPRDSDRRYFGVYFWSGAEGTIGAFGGGWASHTARDGSQRRRIYQNGLVKGFDWCGSQGLSGDLACLGFRNPRWDLPQEPVERIRIIPFTFNMYWPPQPEPSTFLSDVIPEFIPFWPGFSGFDANKFWDDLFKTIPLVAPQIEPVADFISQFHVTPWIFAIDDNWVPLEAKGPDQ